jgi:hypothetical protein
MLLCILDRFVADVAKVFVAFDTCQTVLVVLFHVNSLTTRTQSTKLCVDKWTTCKAQILGDQLWIDFERLNMWFVILTFWVFFEVFLPFCSRKTCPAKPVVANRTLHVRATRFYFLNSSTALSVRTRLTAMLKKKVHQADFCLFVSILYSVELWRLFGLH